MIAFLAGSLGVGLKFLIFRQSFFPVSYINARATIAAHAERASPIHLWEWEIRNDLNVCREGRTKINRHTHKYKEIVAAVREEDTNLYLLMLRQELLFTEHLLNSGTKSLTEYFSQVWEQHHRLVVFSLFTGASVFSIHSKSSPQSMHITLLFSQLTWN